MTVSDAGDSLRLAVDALNDALTLVEELDVTDPEPAHAVFLLAKQAGPIVTGIKDSLATKIGEVLGKGPPVNLNGVPVKRHAKFSHTKWDSDGLLRVVEDSRFQDPDTGEIVTGLDLIARVYPLRGYNAKVTALRELNIDIDQFCTSQWKGWNLADR